MAYEPWPTYDASLLKADTIDVPVQINGKVREKVVVPADAPADVVLAAAKALPKVREALEGKTLVQERVVPGRLVVLAVR